MENEAKGRARRVTDAELRECVQAGMKPSDIARHFSVSQSAISQRLKKLQDCTTSALVAPEESRRFVARQIDVIQQLALNLERANKLQAACDRWLTDADDPTRYDIGPRAEEITVTYEVIDSTGERARILKRRAPLSVLLHAIEEAPGLTVGGEQFYALRGTESRHADPRELILKTQQEARQSVALYTEILQKLLDAQALQAWRQTIIEEVGKESPDCARRIAERLCRTLVLAAAFDGSGGVPS